MSQAAGAEALGVMFKPALSVPIKCLLFPLPAPALSPQREAMMGQEWLACGLGVSWGTSSGGLALAGTWTASNALPV